MNTGMENRAKPRIEIRWPVTMLTTQDKIEGEIRNVSTSGAFISCKETPPLEGSFFIIIKPPNRQTMSVAGKVIWSMILQPSEGDSSHGVGVQFTDMTSGDRQFLSQTVARQYRKKLSRMNHNQKK